MTPIINRKHCFCVKGCDIYSGDRKYKSDGKTYCLEHGRVKSLHNAGMIWIRRQLRDNMAQANAVQKKWMTTITEWAGNGGLRLLYGDQWEFAEFERHHVLGKTAKHNKVAIGHEFILPVPYMLHNIREKNSLNVSYFKNNFTNQFGTQRSLFMKMCDDMFEQGYDLTVIPLDVARAIQDTNA